MKNSWLVWVFVVGVISTVFFAFNYEGGQKAVPLTEIFSEEDANPVDIEYEFVDATGVEQAQPVVVTDTAPRQTVQADQPAEIADSISVAAVRKAEQKIEAAVNPPAEKIAKAQPAETKSETKAATQAPAKDSPYTIQVASFKKQSMADSLKDQLTKEDFAAFVASRDLGSKGTWYRVYVGQYDSKSQAETALNDIKKSYSSSFIISPK